MAYVTGTPYRTSRLYGKRENKNDFLYPLPRLRFNDGAQIYVRSVVSCPFL